MDNTDGKRRITTVEQDGSLAGESVGRVWIGNNETRGASTWRWVQLGNAGAASRAAKSLAGKTAQEIDEWYEAQ